MKVAVEVLQIVLSIVLIVVVLLQSKGAGFGGAFGAQSTMFRTRRGLEEYLFRGTVVLAALFIVVSLWSARIATES